MKKSSHWITLPDETTEKNSKLSPILSVKAAFFKLKNRLSNVFKGSNTDKVEEIKDSNIEKVENKAFWGVGFLILIVFTAALLAPEQLSKLFKGNLFDALSEVEVIPDYEQQNIEFIPPYNGPGSTTPTNEFNQVNTQETETSTEENLSSQSSTNNQNSTTPISGGVQAQTDPVEIQVEPVSDEAINPAESSQTDTQVETESSPQSLQENDTNNGTTQEDPLTGGIIEETDSNAILLQKLAQELSELKESNLEKQAIIEDLKNSGESDLHNAAPDTAAETNNILGESNTNTPPSMEELFNQNNSQAPSSNNLNLSQSVYRENTHKVDISPQQILADFNKKYEQAMLEGYFNSKPASENSNNQFNQIPTTPSSGPLKGFWVSISLTMLIIFGWKCFRIFLRF